MNTTPPRYVIHPNDRRDVHDIEQNRVAQFPTPEDASEACALMNQPGYNADSYAWEDYS